MLILLALACKGPSTADDSATPDDSAPDSGGDSDSQPPAPEGEDVALYDGSLLCWFNEAVAIHTDADWSGTLGDAKATTFLEDLDGDGLNDFLQIPPGTSKINVWLNQGGSFPTESDLTIDTGLGSAHPFVMGDFNGDKKTDIAQFNTNNLRFQVSLATIGAFDIDHKVQTSMPFTGNEHFFAADFDGDGTDDLGVRSGGDVFVYTVVAGVVSPEPLATAQIAGMVDAEGLDLQPDGLADLAVYSGSTLSVYTFDGTTFENDFPATFGLNESGTLLAGEIR